MCLPLGVDLGILREYRTGDDIPTRFIDPTCELIALVMGRRIPRELYHCTIRKGLNAKQGVARTGVFVEVNPILVLELFPLCI